MISVWSNLFKPTKSGKGLNYRTLRRLVNDETEDEDSQSRQTTNEKSRNISQ